jgi:hypothetical protein
MDRCAGGRINPRAAVEYAVLAKGRAPWRPIGLAPAFLERVQGGVEHVEPAGDRPISDDGHDKKVARTGCRHVDQPHRFRPIAS